METLFEALYKLKPPVLDFTIDAIPNIFDGLDFRSGTGELLGSVAPDIFGMALFNEHHEKIATIRENVYGGTQIDFHDGHVLNGIHNAYGGENFYDFSGLVGYTMPGINESIDLYSPTHDLLASAQPDALGGLDITVNATSGTIQAASDFHDQIDIADSLHAFDYFDALDSFDVIHSSSDLVDFFDMTHATMDVYDFLDFMTGWL